MTSRKRKPRGVPPLLLLLSLTVIAVVVQVPSCNGRYVSSCHYFGPQCSHQVGFLENEVISRAANISIQELNREHRNISCTTPQNSTEYCTVPDPSEPDPDRFQCYSLYTVGTNRTRLLISAGCIFNHDLELCTAESCNFSHAFVASSGVELHYCCCHTTAECNRNRIIGTPPTTSSPAPTSPSRLSTTSSGSNPSTNDPNSSGDGNLTIFISAVIAAVVMACVCMLAGVGIWVAYKRRQAARQENDEREIELDQMPSGSAAPYYPQDFPEVPGELIMHRKEGSIIGRGRFSSVHRGVLNGREVAIKVFSQSDESAWSNEWRIYNTLKLQHPNILYFQGAKEAWDGPVMERYLVTEYHANGSLSDYLKCNTVTFNDLVIKATSIACGLEFLHTQRNLETFMPAYVKPTIAHRDLKSKNILVKADRQCCVSDFGLATHFGVNESLTERQGKVGTTRYMAPEVLEGAISFQMESFLRIDIYAFALVMWELIIRCEFNDVPAQHYREPFTDEIGANINATQQNMLRIVVTNKQRPRFPRHVADHTGLDHITRLVRECWDPDPEARLSAQCFLDNLSEISHVGDPEKIREGEAVALPPTGKQPGVSTSQYSQGYDNGAAGGSVSGPPAYSSGNYGQDGVPNVFIPHSDDYQLSGQRPPRYVSSYGGNHNSAMPNGNARTANGGLHSTANGYSLRSPTSGQSDLASGDHHMHHRSHNSHAPEYTSPHVAPAEHSMLSSSIQESSL